jgi:hypothetical protein
MFYDQSAAIDRLVRFFDCAKRGEHLLHDMERLRPLRRCTHCGIDSHDEAIAVSFENWKRLNENPNNK